MKKYKKNNGITLIALVVTVIVLLILAGISVNMLAGQNGILNRATEAKEKTIISKEKEAITYAWNLLIGDKTLEGLEITEGKLEETLKNNGNNVKVSRDENNNFTILFIDTTNTYILDNKGNITQEKTEYYSINYVLNGGINAEDQVTSFAKGMEISLKKPSKDKSYFIGWYETSDFSTDRVCKISGKNADITLYAKWIEETPTDYFEWSTTDDSATINGFSTEGLAAYNAGNLVELVIPSKYNGLEVKTIGDSAFSGKELINSLYIPECVTLIGKTAFLNCSGIKGNLLIENATISSNAFNKCSGIESVEIYSKAIIGSQAFAWCTGLKKVIIGDEVSGFNDTVFAETHNSIEELTIPISISTLKANSSGNEPFITCSGIKKINFTKGTGEAYSYTSKNYSYTPWYYCRNNDITITLEEGITSIGSYMFDECTGLKNIELKNPLVTIGDHAFYNCSNLDIDVNELISNDTTNVGYAAFCNCENVTGNLKIKSFNISGHSFRKTGINSVDIGSSAVIGNDSFVDCVALESVIIRDNVEGIGAEVFIGCKNLKELTMPISLSSLKLDTISGNHPFLSCSSLEKINFTKGTGEAYSYTSKNYSFTPWYYSRTNDLTITLEAGITSIGNYMFYGCTGLKKIELKNPFVTIGDHAFYDCSNLDIDVNELISNDTTDVGYAAFCNCENVTGNLKIKSFNISGHSFRKTGINSVDIESSAVIGNDSFVDCVELESVIIRDNVEGIGAEVFIGCKNLKELTMPISLSSLKLDTISGNHPFLSCSSLEKINFTKGTGEAYSYTSKNYSFTPWYYSRTNDLTITLEDGITSIGDYMFYNCTGLKKIMYKNITYTNKNEFISSFGGTTGNYALNGTGLE